MIWIDVSDIRHFFQHSKCVTGIQRAVINIINQIAAQNTAFRLIVYDAKLHTFREITFEEIFWISPRLRLQSLRIVRAALRLMPAPLKGWLRDAVDSLFQLSTKFQIRPCKFSAGDELLILGAFWHRHGHVDRVTEAVFSNRLRLHLLIHDLMPITYRDWFPRHYAIEWQMQFDALFRHATTIFTNSRYTAREVESYAARTKLPKKPISAIRFGDPIFDKRQPGSKANVAKPKIPSGAFALMVSAIDTRKNQQSLIFVWSRLLRELGEDIPKLILVGPNRVDSGTVYELLEESPHVAGYAEIISNADDETLAAYYQNCLFTIFPSFAEGWGFPVAESLMFGKPCIASKATSIPEVGGDLCHYVDPYDLDDIYRAVKSFILDDHMRAGYETRIAEHYKSTPWSSAADSILGAMRESKTTSVAAA
jgi:glycosyltransferase involved in cell wall biosynthesis